MINDINFLSVFYDIYKFCFYLVNNLVEKILEWVDIYFVQTFCL